MITCTGLWLTCCCDTLFCLHDFSFFLGCFLVACDYCFQSYMQFCASRTRLALTEFLFFGDLKIWFASFAVSVPCFIRLRIWWNCAFWIDDNMHWALIDLFCDTLFVFKTMSFPRLLSPGLLLLLWKCYKQFCASRKCLALTEFLFFGDLKI